MSRGVTADCKNVYNVPLSRGEVWASNCSGEIWDSVFLTAVIGVQ